jgi:hypothetical protein
VSEESSLRADLVSAFSAFPTMTQKMLIVQQEKLLKSAVSGYIDRIVDHRGLRQRVIALPRPLADIREGGRLLWSKVRI